MAKQDTEVLVKVAGWFLGFSEKLMAELERLGVSSADIYGFVKKGGDVPVRKIAEELARLMRLAEKPVSEAEQVRQVQMEHLRARGYTFNEKDVPLPEEAKLKLGLTLLVSYSRAIDQQCQLLGIKNYLDLSYHKDLYQKPQGFGWIYGVENGKKMLGVSPNRAIEEFKRNSRRGLMTVEGLALYRENLDLLKDHYVDLSGSRHDEFDDSVPRLSLSGGTPSLYDRWADDSDAEWGSASAVVV